MINQVTLVGVINSELTYDHNFNYEKYYKMTVTVYRISGVADNIPVIVSEYLINTDNNYINQYVFIKGQYRSHRINNKLILYVFCTDIELVNPADYNEILIEGKILKPPTHRFTPYGREISDILLKVPRAYNKCDYIPCIAWGNTAKYISRLDVNTCIRVAGRVQSREYIKNDELKEAYEVSVNLIEIA